MTPFIKITVHGADDWTFEQTSRFVRWLDEAVTSSHRPGEYKVPGPFEDMRCLSYENGEPLPKEQQ